MTTQAKSAGLGGRRRRQLLSRWLALWAWLSVTIVGMIFVGVSAAAIAGAIIYDIASQYPLAIAGALLLLGIGSVGMLGVVDGLRNYLHEERKP